MRAKLSTTEEAEYRLWAKTYGRGASRRLNLLRWKLYRKAKNEREFRFYPVFDRVDGVYYREMTSNLDSQTVKFAGEPSTGNLYTRFDEGRGGLAFRLAPSSTLLQA